MFATLIGDYPAAREAEPPDQAVQGAVAELEAAGPANASSLAGLTRERARVKVEVLATGARLAATASPDELAAALDPRAVDIRSAALGRYTPKPK